MVSGVFAEHLLFPSLDALPPWHVFGGLIYAVTESVVFFDVVIEFFPRSCVDVIEDRHDEFSSLICSYLANSVGTVTSRFSAL